MKKLLSMVLCLLLVAVLLPAVSRTASADASGTCPDGITWSYDESTATLTIGVSEGSSGVMSEYSASQDFSAFDVFPQWEPYKTKTKHLILEEGIKNIGQSAFPRFTEITSVVIPDSVEKIGLFAFRQCTKLASVTLGANVTELRTGAFRDDPALLSLEIPDSVNILGNDLCANCTALQSVTIGRGVQKIGENVFYQCTNLASITLLSENVTSFGRYCFIGTQWIKDQPEGPVYLGNCLVQYKFSYPYDEREHVEVREGTTLIASNACSSCPEIATVTLPESVRYIGDSAFYSCSNLTSINLPDGVEYIGDHAFRGCKKMLQVDIPSAVKIIGMDAFYECELLESVVLPEGLEQIYGKAFFNCTGLKSVTISNAIRSIPYDTFSGCTGITSITMPCDLAYPGYFSSTRSVSSVHLTAGCGVTTGYSDRTYQSSPWGHSDADIIEIILDEGITTISDYAFYKCQGLKEITIPDSVTSIGYRSFTNSGLETVRIGRGLTVIPDSSFLGCKALKTVYLPVEVTQIKPAAFSGTAIQDVYYSGYEILKEAIDIGQSNKPLLEATWHYAELDPAKQCGDNLSWEYDEETETLTIRGSGDMWDFSGEWVESDDDRYFHTDVPWYGYPIKHVVFPNHLTSIGTYAFYESDAAYISLPDDLMTIGEHAFDGSAVIILTLPKSVTTIRENAFEGAWSLSNVYYAGSELQRDAITIENKESGNNSLLDATWRYNKLGPEPEKCGGNLWWEIDFATDTLIISGSGAMWDFEYQWDDEEDEEGDSLLPLDSSATRKQESERVMHAARKNRHEKEACAPWGYFSEHIKHVQLSQRLTSIGDHAFAWFTKLETIDLPDSVTRIGKDAFGYCESLKEITIPEKVTAIEDWTFGDCYQLESVTLPESLVSIGAYAFAYCDSLESIDIPAGVTSIGEGAFFCCILLPTVELPDGLTEISDCTFEYCSSLSSVTIPDGVVRIGACAFDASGLKSIVIPANVESIGSRAFTSCFHLPEFTVAPENTAYCAVKGVLFNAAKDTLITYPAGSTRTQYRVPSTVTSILPYAFIDSRELVSVTLPNGLTRIEKSAFRYCSSLDSIRIPEGVTSIGECAFDGCDALTEVTLPADVTSIDDYAFGWSVSSEPIDVYYSGSEAQRAEIAVRYGNNKLLDGNWHYDYVYPVMMEGDCGDDLSWIFDGGTGTLTIEGSGNMWDFETGNDDTSGVEMKTPDLHAPWYDLREQITSIEFPTELTHIGAASFYCCTALTEGTIPNKVKSIGAYAFANNTALTSVTMGNTVETIGEHAFDGCDALTDVYYDLNGKQAAKIGIAEGNDAIRDTTGWHVNEFLYGDANGDGLVTAADAAAVLRHVVHLIELTEQQQVYCNVDGNNRLTAADAAAILRHVVKLINIFER